MIAAGLAACTLMDRSYLQAELHTDVDGGGGSSADTDSGIIGGGGVVGTAEAGAGGSAGSGLVAASAGIESIAGSGGAESTGGSAGISGSVGTEPTGGSTIVEHTGGAAGLESNGGRAGAAGHEEVIPADTSTGLVVHYEFDATSGTTVADSTASKKHATLYGDPQWTTGRIDGGLHLDGPEDYVALPDDFVGNLQALTVAVWVKYDSHTLNERIFAFGATDTVMELAYSYDATPFFAIQNLSVSERIEGPGELPLGTWVHLAVTLDLPVGRLYVGGQEVAWNSSLTLGPEAVGYTTSNFIGRQIAASPVYLRATLDDFRVYDRALTARDVAALAAMDE